ncbi:hypothetical protein MATL_G00220450 [Megalops atlanticus]|uniref:AIG1-type G domain-containing protein n=1 Tax=Megalops atlanticus TaxID=7932 RepID=A0A9D3PEB5_MEGAT|nr:hypothetical protein MATL_G00220450 [Megalops atlanticus]
MSGGKSDLRILLIGKKGVGKTTAVEAIGGEPNPGPTQCPAKYRHPIDGRTVVMVDTPGLSEEAEHAFRDMIFDALPLTNPGPNAILMVLDAEEKNQAVLETVIDALGVEAKKHIVILLVNRANKDEQELVDVSNAELGNEYEGRYIFFNGKSSPNPIQVSQLLEMITELSLQEGIYQMETFMEKERKRQSKEKMTKKERLRFHKDAFIQACEELKEEEPELIKSMTDVIKKLPKTFN